MGVDIEALEKDHPHLWHIVVNLKEWLGELADCDRFREKDTFKSNCLTIKKQDDNGYYVVVYANDESERPKGRFLVKDYDNIWVVKGRSDPDKWKLTLATDEEKWWITHKIKHCAERLELRDKMLRYALGVKRDKQ